MTFSGSRSPRRERTKNLPEVLILVIGIFIGFLAASFLSMASYEAPKNPRVTLSVPSSESLLPKSVNKRQCSGICDDSDGWNTIHVFYGNASYLPQASSKPLPKDYLETTEWFSQVRQDQVVSTLLKKKRNGYFVDLASNDAVRISNTYALETNFDWQGLCIEPNPLYWPSLSYRKCNVVAAVVGPERMQAVQFKFPNRAAPRGGIVGPEFDNKEPSKFGEDHARYTVTLLEIFQRFDTPAIIDYLSLDIEGAEYFVMERFPFDRYRFNVLTVERPSDKLRRLLQAHDYILLKQLRQWGETVWVHRSVENTLDKSALDIDTEHYKYKEPR